jgi:hypothetical protein
MLPVTANKRMEAAAAAKMLDTSRETSNRKPDTVISSVPTNKPNGLPAPFLPATLNLLQARPNIPVGKIVRAANKTIVAKVIQSVLDTSASSKMAKGITTRAGNRAARLSSSAYTADKNKNPTATSASDKIVPNHNRRLVVCVVDTSSKIQSMPKRMRNSESDKV